MHRQPPPPAPPPPPPLATPLTVSAAFFVVVSSLLHLLLLDIGIQINSFQGFHPFFQYHPNQFEEGHFNVGTVLCGNLEQFHPHFRREFFGMFSVDFVPLSGHISFISNQNLRDVRIFRKHLALELEDKTTATYSTYITLDFKKWMHVLGVKRTPDGQQKPEAKQKQQRQATETYPETYKLGSLFL